MNLVENVISLYKENVQANNLGHSEWFEYGAMGDIRLFAPFDYTNSEYFEIQMEKSNGEVFELSEIDTELLQFLIDCLKPNLIERVVEEIKKDLLFNDVEALEELLSFIDKKYLIGYLPEEEWGKYED